jgi:hypothetical protein
VQWEVLPVDARQSEIMCWHVHLKAPRPRRTMPPCTGDVMIMGMDSLAHWDVGMPACVGMPDHTDRHSEL